MALLSANFTISPAAKGALLDAQRLAGEISPNDPPILFGLSAGWPSDSAGKRTGGDVLIVSHYLASQYSRDAEDEIIEASNLRLVLGDASIRRRVAGRVVDYTAERGLFVRDRQAGDPS